MLIPIRRAPLPGAPCARFLATPSAPSLLKPNRLMIARSRRSRNNRGFGFPGWGCGVTVPISATAKTKRRPGRNRRALLVETRAKPEGIAELEAEHLLGESVVDWLLSTPQRVDHQRLTERRHRQIVGAFGVESKKRGPQRPRVEAHTRTSIAGRCNGGFAVGARRSRVGAKGLRGWCKVFCAGRCKQASGSVQEGDTGRCDSSAPVGTQKRPRSGS